MFGTKKRQLVVPPLCAIPMSYGFSNVGNPYFIDVSCTRVKHSCTAIDRYRPARNESEPKMIGAYTTLTVLSR